MLNLGVNFSVQISNFSYPRRVSTRSKWKLCGTCLKSTWSPVMACRVASRLQEESTGEVGQGGAWRLKAQVGGGGPALGRWPSGYSSDHLGHRHVRRARQSPAARRKSLAPCRNSQPQLFQPPDSRKHQHLGTDPGWGHHRHWRSVATPSLPKLWRVC